MNSVLQQLQDEISQLRVDLSNTNRLVAIMHAREEVNDAMFLSLIATHPDRAELREAWRKMSSTILPGLLVKNPDPFNDMFSDTAKLRASYLNSVLD